MATGGYRPLVKYTQQSFRSEQNSNTHVKLPHYHFVGVQKEYNRHCNRPIVQQCLMFLFKSFYNQYFLALKELLL